MENFIYSTPTKVYFGKNEELKIGKIIKEFNPNKVLIHFGFHIAKEHGLLSKIEELLTKEHIKYVELGGVHPNPSLDMVRKGIQVCQKENVDFILAIGGGSVIDSAKDIANGVANPEIDVWEFSKNKIEVQKTLHKGAILTIAAAGSEMSNSCVITNEETHEKLGYCSEKNRLDFVIENPELSYTVSKYQTACGTVDIAMHTIERFFCPGEGMYVTDEIALGVIKSVIKAGKDAFDKPYDYDARANMMWASSLAHNGLTGCGRTFQLVVHQFEHELSGMYPEIAHGAGLAALWCSWARYVYKYNLDRWALFFENIWDLQGFSDKNSLILEGINRMENYYKYLCMPTSLRELNVKEEDLEILALKCSRNKTRILTGYKPLDYDDILAIYKMAF